MPAQPNQTARWEEPQGGSGSLPDWWTIDSTPGSELATFDGALELHQTNTSIRALKLEGMTGQAANGNEIFEVLDENGGRRLVGLDAWGQWANDLYQQGAFSANTDIYLHPTGGGQFRLFRVGSEGIQLSNYTDLPIVFYDLNAGAETMTIEDGQIIKMFGLPTADPGVAGQLWNSSGTLKISP